jgi:CHAT domain-containing protein
MKPVRLPLILLIGFMSLSLAPGALTAAVNAELDSAVQLYRAEGAEKALPLFEQLYEGFEEDGDRASSARARHYVGESHWRLGNYEAARAHLDAALTEMRAQGLPLEEGKVLNVLGLLEWDLGNYKQAISSFQQASEIGAELGDRRLAGSTMNNLSLVYDELGDYQTSLRQYQQALDLYQGADFPRGESDTLGNIGGVHLLLGRYEEARAYYQRALAISETLESKPSMSLDHGNLGQCYLGLGQADTAMEHFEVALNLAIETGMRKEQALWLRGKANARIQKGQYDLGLENHRAALAIYEDINARGMLLDALHDTGHLYLTLGDSVSAEQYFQRGMEMAREIGLERVVSANLLALGDLQFHWEHLEEAAALYKQALQRTRKAGELNYQVESLLRLSLVHRKQERFSEAGEEARQALALAGKINAETAVTEAWYALGELARLQADLDAAFENYEKAQLASGIRTDPDILWRIHYGRALAQMDAGERQSAISELKAAVTIIESVRDRLREQRFRAGYVQDKYKVYVDLVRLQLDLGLIRQAFSTAERLRARSFFDQLGNSSPILRIEQDRQHEFALRERVRQLQLVLAKEQGLAPPERRQLAMDTFSSELLAAEREYQSFLDDVQSRSTAGRAARIPELTEVQARLAPGEALVEYVVGDDRLMIFVMKAGELSATTVEARQIDLFAKVNLVRDFIQQPSNDLWWAPAASLAESLILPLQNNDMLAGVDHLYLVPHGILNYLPFALLPLESEVEERVVMERFSLSYLPAAVTLARNLRTTDNSQSLLALAPAKARLRYALEEARSVSELYQPDSQLFIGEKATESIFKEQADGFRVVHLSTHGYFNVDNPLLSGLELEADDENDGLLEVHEILGMSLAAELVTLSACETGMGSGYFNQIPAGEEFVGLTRAFLLAGSHAVLATLWQVDDRSTVELMEGFYKRLYLPGQAHDQAIALAQVQRELRNSVKHRHPFYWAPFVLVGQQDRQQEAQNVDNRG